MTVVVAPPIFWERQMSKRKPATAPKRARNPKMAARAQRNKQAVVRSPKENLLRSVAAVSIEPPLKLHDDPKHEVPIIEPRVDALPDDLSQRMRDSDPTKGFALATANMQAYQAKLLEIARANVQFAFEFGLRLATIRSPTEFFGVITEFTNRRIDMFGQHSKELAAYPFWRIKPPRELTALAGR
jgi:Phasin protein